MPCSACDCDTTKTTPGISFHRFPMRKPKILKKWIRNVGRADWYPTQNSRLCSKHFKPECFQESMYHKLKGLAQPKRLAEDAIPTQFQHRQQELKRRLHTEERIQKKERKELVAHLLASPKSESNTKVMLHPPCKKKKATKKLTVSNQRPMEAAITSSQERSVSTEANFTGNYGTPTCVLVQHSYLPEPSDCGTTVSELFPANSSPPSESSQKMHSDSNFVILKNEEGSNDQPSSTKEYPVSEPKYIVFQSKLEELFQSCSKCGSPITNKIKFATGSMVSYSIECYGGCKYTWRSQPEEHHVPFGNLLF